jgi:capsid protein
MVKSKGWVASSLEKGVMRRQYEKEELRAARLGATLTGTFKTSSDFKAIFDALKPHERDAITKMLFENFGLAGDSVPMRIDDFLNLPPLTEAQAFDTKHPHSGFASHRQESLKGQGRSLRMPENIATGSSANYNYASVQRDTQDWFNHLSCIRRDIEIVDLLPMFESFLTFASVYDRKLEDVRNGNIHPVIPTFYWKEMEHADPLKQANAHKIYHRMGALSLDDIIMKLGKDPEKQKDEVKASMDEMKNYTVFDKGETLSTMPVRIMPI